MSTLFVSPGTSPAVVPEAFLLSGVDFTAVHVLTTDSTAVDFVRTDMKKNWTFSGH